MVSSRHASRLPLWLYELNFPGSHLPLSHHAQLFNEINSRKIRDELNVFKGFLSSIVFTVVLALTVGFQVRACAGWAAPCVGPGGEVASRGA